ncbi:T9SS type A sorting domain-containing protein [Flavobacterium sp. MFBS3-15]|uniref:Ig-like domain-containing protein n=1 Tax=Flavobacterium sp. MFBS3-15 TaxID=2989816 RepID=UPI0022355302|nr:T9SS type A sorting domain-containing protein [Flavobacterium sp. MFBS3-15]MCW4469765.1 T9SS type A sorting domain-containing protein [Flavobacterium sp. MFBS3-15]
MKKLLLIASLLLSVAGLHAQSKTTGVVNLMSGMTAKLDLDNANSTATLTLTGPSDRWFALQFGSFASGGGMGDGQDLVYYNGTTLVDAVHNGIGVTPSADGTNNWTVTSNTVSGTTRTIVATRPFNTGSAGDYTFVYSNADIDFAYAKGASASFTLANHGGSNRGYALNRTFTCIPPSNPTASAQGFCAGATIANLTATGAGGATFNWYANSTGGSALAGTTVLNNATYYVSQTVGGCESARVPVAVTITTVAQPTANATQQFCSEATVANLTATGAGTINWYNVAAGGSPLAGNTVLVAGNYYVSQTVGTCESTRFTVAVSYTTLATPTTADNTQDFCSGATVADIQATAMAGAQLHWYAVAAGGTELSLTDGLASTTYYVSQTLGSCVSERLAITVTVTPVAGPTTNNETQAFCDGATVSELSVNSTPGAMLKYYVANDATALPGTTVMADGTTYAVTQTIGSCESPAQNIMVIVNPIPAMPGGGDTQQFTAGETIADLEITILIGATITWYVDDNGNMAEVPVTTALADGMTYYVTQTLNGCESAAKAILVDEALSTEGFELKSLMAFPNPVSDVLTISNNTALDNIAIYNLLGQKVLSQKAGANTTEINVSGLPAGSYTVKAITTSGASASLKVMKQ